MLPNNIFLFALFTKSYKAPIIVFILKLWFVYMLLVCSSMLLTSCKKLVRIDEPVSSITTKGAFSSDASATSSVLGIYSNLINTDGSLVFGNGAITLFVGLSSDELSRTGLSGDINQYYTNNLLPDNRTIPYQLWGSTYFAIYQANSCLDALENPNGVSQSLINQLIGECKFLRAFCYFYLTNLWGDIPMPLTSDWNKTYLVQRTAKADVYNQIISDLKDAQQLLPADYAISGNERIRANKFAATALLARVYLYQQDWTNAETQSTEVINSTGLYNLVNNLNNVFLKNSSEAILQFQPNNKSYPYTVNEPNVILGPPVYYLTNSLINSFDSSDKRKSSWTKATSFSGTTLYMPYKYKISFGSAGGTVQEYYMVLRLAEQYLIRAEARAHLNKFSEAEADLNIIRNRAFGTPNLTTANDQASLLLAIEKERQWEFFAEWGHRWFDLIRTNRANAVLSGIKGTNWQPTDQLYPIPVSELQKNPNLTQNDGY
jgi:hypothetical protein